MSAAQSQSSLDSELEALQCHFTWDLDLSRSRLFRLRDNLQDIGTEEGNSWLGHIYNLQGYVQYKLGLTEDAQSFFSRAAEAFSQTRTAAADEGPWLVVNYGNLAWLHHHLGEQAECQTYLSKVDALMSEYPSPSQDELHPEIYAEKAWTLMKFSGDKQQLAADCFRRAIRMQPETVEWNTSHLIGLARAVKHSETGLDAAVLESMRIATEQDPENLYLACVYLKQRAENGERVEDEARELARNILRNPVSSYSGMKAVLRVYRISLTIDEAIALAEEALENHPDARFLKRCAALCYKWKIIFDRNSRPNRRTIARAVSLHRELIALYPHSSLVKKLDLANIYGKTNPAEAEPIYRDLLESDAEPAEQQMIYHHYANYLNFVCQDRRRSIQYHRRAAAIPHQSYFRDKSIRVLERIRDRGRNPMSGDIAEFLANLQEPESL